MQVAGRAMCRQLGPRTLEEFQLENQGRTVDSLILRRPRLFAVPIASLPLRERPRTSENQATLLKTVYVWSRDRLLFSGQN